MAGTKNPPPHIRFGPFELNLSAGELRKGGLRIRLQDQPFQILVMLLDQPGEVVTREEFHQKLWPKGTFVDFEHGLNAAIKRLRDALNDSAENPLYIETIPRRGYRFIGQLEKIDPGSEVSEVPRRPKWIPVLAVVAGLAMVAFAVWKWQQSPAQPAERKVMLAVLPFENLSGDPAQDYFSDGLTDEMITQLGRLQSDRLGVIARTSAMHYRGTQKPAQQVGRELGVDYILSGTVRREGERVRISAQLVQVRDQTQLWAENYDRELSGILNLQSEVARAIAQQTQLTLAPGTLHRLAENRQTNPKAYELYLRGRHFWNKRTDEGFRRALELFQQAIAIDPNYALAYAGLADTFVLMVEPSPEETSRRARAAALKALEFDPTLAEAHASLALVSTYDWDWIAAEKGFKQAIALNPSCTTAHQWYSVLLSFLGRHDEAIAEAKRARQLDPLSLTLSAAVGMNLCLGGYYDQALEQLLETLKLDENFYRSHLGLALVYLQKGMQEKALQEFQWLYKHSPGPEELANLGYAYAVAGKKEEARKIVAQLNRLDETLRRRHGIWVQLARIYCALGEYDKAFQNLNQAFEAHSWRLADVKADRAWDSVRNDPRFQDLLLRMKFPE